MSFLETLAAGLHAMGFAQMGCAHAALLAYIVALNGSLPVRWRGVAALTAIIGVAAFAALAPSWPGGVFLALLGIVGCALFTALAWGLAALIGVESVTRGVRDLPLPGDRDLPVASVSVFPCVALTSPLPLSRSSHPHRSAPAEPSSP